MMTSAKRIVGVAMAVAMGAGGTAQAAEKKAQATQLERAEPALTPEQERLRDFSRIQNFVMTLGDVDGAPLRTYHDASRKTTCYFWKASISCVKD